MRSVISVDCANGFTYIGDKDAKESNKGLIRLVKYVVVPTQEVAVTTAPATISSSYNWLVGEFYKKNRKNLESVDLTPVAVHHIVLDDKVE